MVTDCVTTNQYGGYGIYNGKDPKEKKPLCKKDSLQCTKFIGLNFKDNLPTKALFKGPVGSLYSGPLKNGHSCVQATIKSHKVRRYHS